MGEEANGFGAMVGVMEEGLIERGMLVRPDECQDRVAQESEVFGTFGFSPRPAILTPQGGILFPVVFVFHRPVAAGDFGKPRVACLPLFQAGEEVAGFAFEPGSTFLFPIKTRETHQLPRSGEQGGVQIQCNRPQLAPFDAPVFALGLGDPVGGTSVEFPTRELIEGGLVVLEGVEVMASGGGDDQCCFFWL